jgi:hypothetical protein
MVNYANSLTELTDAAPAGHKIAIGKTSFEDPASQSYATQNAVRVGMPDKSLYGRHVDAQYQVDYFDRTPDGQNSTLDLDTARVLHIMPIDPAMGLNLDDQFLTMEHYSNLRPTEDPERFIRCKTFKDEQGNWQIGEEILTKQSRTDKNGAQYYVDAPKSWTPKSEIGRGIRLSIPEDRDILLRILKDPRCANVSISYGKTTIGVAKYYYVLDETALMTKALKFQQVELEAFRHATEVPQHKLEGILTHLGLIDSVLKTADGDYHKDALRYALIDYAKTNNQAYYKALVGNQYLEDEIMLAFAKRAGVLSYSTGMGYSISLQNGSLVEVGADQQTVIRAIRQNPAYMQEIRQRSRYGRYLELDRMHESVAALESKLDPAPQAEASKKVDDAPAGNAATPPAGEAWAKNAPAGDSPLARGWTPQKRNSLRAKYKLAPSATDEDILAAIEKEKQEAEKQPA